MSIWTKISQALSALANGESLSAVFDRLRTPPERTIAFTIAVIALGAKMAKADGRVTRDEVTAFRQVFQIPSQDQDHAARVFNLARQDVAGYDIYARRIGAMFGAGHQTLRDLLEGLFYIAIADGTYHPQENTFLAEVAKIFGISGPEFERLRTTFVPDAAPDPYCVLGIDPTDDPAIIRAAYRKLAREYHPDQLIARGLPQEAFTLAERKMAQINDAYDHLRKGR